MLFALRQMILNSKIIVVVSNHWPSKPSECSSLQRFSEKICRRDSLFDEIVFLPKLTQRMRDAMFTTTSRNHWLYGTILIGLTLSAIGCADAVPKKRVAAILRVDRAASGRSASDYMVYKETQAALLKSRFVANSALRDRDLSEIDVTSDQLVNQLAVTIDETELIYVSLPLGNRTAKQTARLLDRLISAYEQAVVNRDRVEKIDTLNKLRKRYAKLFDSISKKTDEIQQLKKQLQQNDPLSNQMLARRMEVFNEKAIELRLAMIKAETEEADGSDSVLELMQSQLDVINRQIEEDSVVLASANEPAVESGDLKARHEDLIAMRRDLQSVHDDMHKLEVELDGPRGVQVIQHATLVE